MPHTTITVAAFQGRAIYNDIPQTLKVIQETLTWAERQQVDILCFPECFLQGYLLDKEKAFAFAVDIASSAFELIATSLSSTTVTVVLGVIEKEGDHLYNTAVVIEAGAVIGRYRKRYIHNKETHFTAGTDSPVFVKNGIRYGINICYDSRFPEAADALVNQGVQLILCPLNNSLPHAKADEWRDKHIRYLIAKAQQNGCWILSADAVEQSETNTGYGCTALLTPQGEVVEYVAHLQEGKFLHEIGIKRNA